MATCYVPLAGNKRMAVTATALLVADSNWEGIKAGHTLQGNPVKQKLREVLRAARLAESFTDERWRVTCDITPPPNAEDRSWEFAAVIADRLVRGIWRPTASEVYVIGYSDDWLTGDLQVPPDLPARLEGLSTTNSDVICLIGTSDPARSGFENGLPQHWSFLGNIASLDGHPATHRHLRTASAWFPAVWDGGADQLIRVDVGVRSTTDILANDDPIDVLGLERERHPTIASVLRTARRADPKGPGRWTSVVRFASAAFQGSSWELAVVIADRIARGREWPARGRLIATGTSVNWAAGKVANVEGVRYKCALLESCVQLGDRILLPAEWCTQMPESFTASIISKGASVALVDSFLGT